MSKKNREQRSNRVDTVSVNDRELARALAGAVVLPSEPEASLEPGPTASAPEAVQESVSVARIVELVDRINVHKRVYRVFPGPRGYDVQFPRASERLLAEVRVAIAREMPGAAMVNGRPCALTRLPGT